MPEEGSTPTGVHRPTGPESHASHTFVFASIGRRFVALLIDGFLIGLVVYFLSLGKQSTMNAIQPIIHIAYHTFMIGQYGYTLGKRIMGISVVTYDGTKPDWMTAVIRALVSEISAAVFVLGYIWAFFNNKNQTWHDLAAKTYVVDQPSA